MTGQVYTLTIIFEPQSGSVQLEGPLTHTFWCAGALMEALRVIQRHKNEQEAAKRNGGSVVVVPAGSIPL